MVNKRFWCRDEKSCSSGVVLNTLVGAESFAVAAKIFAVQLDCRSKWHPDERMITVSEYVVGNWKRKKWRVKFKTTRDVISVEQVSP